ncbi:E3 ubiquitin-protein ligase WAV3 isoform X2 [Rhodamnia argentea]|uniref:E3 ubiquitin-protein ligase WAV3 isoform X2 n=1 Tax=Rhodamnia argentea TaxID=178133 RepID=A0A8B8QIN9_9MYRT|nr:E3 ubiquitin-protein ligase WAV3 isoform X2 [Rhodamnia argentea]
MGSKWRKLKLALGLDTACLYVPQTLDDPAPPPASDAAAAARFSDAASLSPTDRSLFRRPRTPTPSSSGLRFPKSSSPKSSKRTCAICLNTMKPGEGHAIFTAECSHSFHFHCITSNVKHGNQLCPVCRAKWKEIPLQKPASGLPHGRARIDPLGRAQDDGWLTVLPRIHQARLDGGRPISSHPHGPEPSRFDDDEPLDSEPDNSEESTLGTPDVCNTSFGIVEVKMYPEVPALLRSTSTDKFNVLIHIKAPQANKRKDISETQAESLQTQKSRAPIDLVTVLDVSGSMAGSKLALLKRAMGFVIQNLGPSDRLSVIAFSSTARRLFPLQRMTDIGRQQALQAVNSLTSNGGTNIAEGLKKGAKVLSDRKCKNPVGSIILLSDGQDTYSVSSPGASAASHCRGAQQSLLPLAMFQKDGTGLQIPVHTFGFGTDHDAAMMHSIAETSGGTFSFIEAEDVIQDAFAQCIGGLLSVVIQELQVKVQCADPSLQFSSIKSGSYQSTLSSDERAGSVDVGDLYAEEERDFLVTIKIPVDDSGHELSLLKVICVYRDPITKEFVSLEEASEVKIQRPETAEPLEVSMEVDRQLNRLRAAEAMAEARAAAERGDMAAAVSILENCLRVLSETVSAQAADRLCTSLCAELKEMQERMANRRIYEASGRAYVLSGLSSHSWQRATARGDSTNSNSLVQAYQTPTMVDMVTQSQTMILGNPMPRRKLRQALSFPGPRPRK